MFGALGWLLEMCCTLLLQTNTKGTVFWSKTKLLDKIVLLGVCFFVFVFQPWTGISCVCCACLLVCFFTHWLLPQTSGLKSANTELFSSWSPGHAEQLGVVKTPRQWSQPMHGPNLQWLDLMRVISFHNFVSGFILYIYMVTTFKYVEGGPDREATEVVWNTSSYI